MAEIVTSVQEVADLLRARTKVSLGDESGAFSANTRPTSDQVTSILAQAKRTVVGAIGTSTPCTDDLAATTAAVIHQRAAMQVELTYYPEQVNTNHSPYEQLKDLYQEELKQLIEAIAETCGKGIGAEGISNQLPSFGYGNAPLLGKRTRL